MFQASPSPSHVEEGSAAGTIGDNTRVRVINVQRTVKTLELLRFQNRQQRGIKPRFRFGSVLAKNRSFGTDFDNRNNTNCKFPIGVRGGAPAKNSFAAFQV